MLRNIPRKENEEGKGRVNAVFSGSPQQLLDLILFHQIIPIELRYLVHNYYCEQIEDKGDLRRAVLVWLFDPELARIRYGHISYWNTSKVTDMAKLFATPSQQEMVGYILQYAQENDDHQLRLPHFQQARSQLNENLNGWDVRQVLDMSDLFAQCHSFNQPLDRWNVNNVKDTSSMFYCAYKFNQPIGMWNVSKVTTMESMFAMAQNFNQPLQNWNISNVRMMSSMFTGALSFNQPLNQWSVSEVCYMEHMFKWASAFNQPLNSWDIRRVISTACMFQQASEFNQPLDQWDVPTFVKWIPCLKVL